MKVLKKEDISNWKYEHTCVNCRSVLELDKDDLVFYCYAGDMREDGYEAFKSSCPVCCQEFYLKTQEIPRLLQIETKKKYKK